MGLCQRPGRRQLNESEREGLRLGPRDGAGRSGNIGPERLGELADGSEVSTKEGESQRFWLELGRAGVGLREM